MGTPLDAAHSAVIAYGIDENGQPRALFVNSSGILQTPGGGGGGGVVQQGARDVSAQPWNVQAAALPLPAGAAQEHVGAASYHSARLTDGAAFYDARDVTDRAARLLGHITVDNATLAVTQSGTWTVAGGANVFHVDDNAGSLTVDGTITANQGGAPWSQNLTQVGGVAIPAIDAAIGSAVPLLSAGRASNAFPTAMSADGDVQAIWLDRFGTQFVRPRQVATYVAIFRLALAAASSKLAFTFTANTDKQLATIYHANTATKNVRIRRVWVQIISTGAVAGEVQLELRQLSATTAPATGNPAITPGKRDASDAAAEATCLALPGTAGSEVAANSPIASSIVNLAASAGTASGTGLVPQDPGWFKLYDEASADDEEKPPLIRAGVAEGFAVIGRSTAAVPLNFIVRMVFTEES